MTLTFDLKDRGHILFTMYDYVSIYIYQNQFSTTSSLCDIII